MGPLDAVWQWFEYARDSIDFTAAQVTKRPRESFGPLVFAQAEPGPGPLDNLWRARTELSDLTVLALFAVFEQALLDHLILTGQKVRQGLASGIQDALVSRAFEGLDRWPLGDILDVYKVVLDPALVGMVKQVKDYRDWVAHGKKEAPSARIDPKSAHERLSTFLSALS
jgi:hypothetical protein